jgi:hypothetical protein
LVNEIAVEPITVWAALGTFIFGMLVGVMIVLGEVKRARRRWREVTRAWHEIEAVAVELGDEVKELPRHNAPDLVAAIRDGVLEQLKRERSGHPDPFTYCCPRTGRAVQGWTVDDQNRSGENYEPVTCAACGLTHLVNPKSGTALESS